jgi:D-sedoheptulose 7-phosphate isomerase
MALDCVNLARQVISRSGAAVLDCIGLADQVADIGTRIERALSDGHKVMACGNGGSAADAQHFVAELMGRFTRERGPLAAIALTTNSSILTAVANDYSFQDVFARQVRALAQPGDILVGISTSGNSENVLEAFRTAPAFILKVALCGKSGQLGALADTALLCPGATTADIQATHIVLIHAICAVVESRLDPSPPS